MNTTNTTSSLIGRTQSVAAAKITVGNLLCMNGGIIKKVIGVRLFEDGYVSIYWDGGHTMCEGDIVLRIQTN